jgi:hypothetical protein
MKKLNYKERRERKMEKMLQKEEKLNSQFSWKKFDSYTSVRKWRRLLMLIASLGFYVLIMVVYIQISITDYQDFITVKQDVNIYMELGTHHHYRSGSCTFTIKDMSEVSDSETLQLLIKNKKNEKNQMDKV